MTVRRIVPNLTTDDPPALAAFYRTVLGLAPAMDLGFAVTLAAGNAPVQLTFAREGGGGTPVPAISVEVDDFEATLARATAAGGIVEYGPVDEPWGVRRFFLRDPAGHLINILRHVRSPEVS